MNIPASLTTGIWIWIVIGILTMILLQYVTAPYGRHTRSDWGPSISNRLGWIIMELPALLVFAGLFLSGNPVLTTWAGLFAGLWIFHYCYRALLFPFLIHTPGKKMPLVIVLSAIFFNTVNGSTNGYWLGHMPFDEPSLLRIITGGILFVVGFLIHVYHDRMLIRIRRTSGLTYVIPSGGLFRYVASPNYLGEILEWAGFAILVWNLPAFAFLIWTCANLIPRARHHLQWYRATFTDFPSNRKAIFPGLL